MNSKDMRLNKITLEQHSVSKYGILITMIYRA